MILQPAENGQNEGTPVKGIKRIVLKSLFFMFLLSSVMLFSSCYATVSTPRVPRQRHSVVIVGSDNGRHDNGNHYGRERRERRHRDND